MDGLNTLPGDRQASAPILDLLRSFGFEDSNTLYSLAARLPAADIDDPTRAARIAIGQWFARLLDQAELDAEEAFLLGRAAFTAVDCNRRRPESFLAEEVPGELVSRLRLSLRVSCPPDTPAVMMVQPLDPPAPFAAVVAWFRRRPRPVRSA